MNPTGATPRSREGAGPVAWVPLPLARPEPWPGLQEGASRRALAVGGHLRALRPGLVQGEACAAQRTGPGAPVSRKAASGRSQVSGTQHCLRPPGSEGVASAPAIPSASPGPTEGLCSGCQQCPPGGWEPGPQPSPLLQPPAVGPCHSGLARRPLAHSAGTGRRLPALTPGRGQSGPPSGTWGPGTLHPAPWRHWALNVGHLTDPPSPMGN